MGSVSDLLPEQSRLRILCWKLGPTRGTPGAMEHIAAPWHTEFLDADDTEQFTEVYSRVCHITRQRTFEPDFEVKSIFVPGKTTYCIAWAFEVVVT